MRLFPHQEEGARALAAIADSLGGRAYLADPPGLGKTRTLIRALELRNCERPLVIAPARVQTHWRREFQAMGHATAPSVVSYDYFTRNVHMFDPSRFDSLVLDEAHRVRSRSAKRTQHILGERGIARRMSTVLAASGTPMWKNPTDLWTVMASLFPSLPIEAGITTSGAWMHRFCRYREGLYGPKVTGVRNKEELQAMLGRCTVRRESVEMDFPLLWGQLFVDGRGLSPIEDFPGLAEAIELAEIVGALLEDVIPFEHLATYRRAVGIAKAGAVGELLASELTDTDEKVVVFAHHRSVLDSLHAQLLEFGVARVDGDTSPREADRAIEWFQEETNDSRVFLGQTRACQEGITLTAARRVILVEPDWTANVNVQAAKRVARIGQRAPFCLAQMVSLAGTLDEAIVRQNLNEARMQTEVLNTATGLTLTGSVA